MTSCRGSLKYPDLLWHCRHNEYKPTQTPVSQQTTFVQSNTTQAYFNSKGYPSIYVTCFGLYLGHPQAYQYTSHTKQGTTKEDTISSIFICMDCVLTRLRMASVQTETCCIDVRVIIWIKINLFCVTMNKCGLFSNKHNEVVSIKITHISTNNRNVNHPLLIFIGESIFLFIY